ncbi:heterocyst development glycosyltransferase HepC [Rivularia sp. UHCC 0363]|uniref:heterocyst development glycosyltransferase HepC n=1 Tax=Rivularia sp. UHCC 0363 TaxID=3110244 RepID=UPI002B202C02|nr:heterocyst development glycosyltransferase HepC [Rivularia sp. UHCC 0363]MEA5598886.1 heterocyst development glycosyltransferase HepC [Rivularia sp. UHCC 0363]
MVHEQRSTSVSLIPYPNLDANSWNDSDTDRCNYNFGYKIKLKDEKLLVKRTCKPSQMHLLSNRSEGFLADWLKFSPATIVEIDSQIELEHLKMWANQCRRCKKTVFLRLSQQEKLCQYSGKLNNLYQFIKRCCDFFGALILLIIFTPILIAIAILIRFYFNEPILQTQWYVGKQGKLFCIYKWGGNLREIHLDVLSKLPQLFNVLQGNMSLIGRFPWSLSEVIAISCEQNLSNFDNLPGITEAWIKNN